MTLVSVDISGSVTALAVKVCHSAF